MKSIFVAFVIGLAVSQCPANDPFCGKCSGTVCQYCWDSYLTTNGTCVKPTNTIDNCQSYANNNLCAACIEDYYLDGNGKCAKIPDSNCASYTVGVGCIACKNGIRVVSGVCNSTNTCSTANCNVCLENNICAKCNSNYVLGANNTCVQGSPAVQNCVVATQSGCSLCQRGFFDSNGACLQSGVTKSISRVIVGSVFGLIVGLFI